MNLKLKEIQSAYDFLRSMPPFNKWRIPESQTLVIKLIRSDRVFGEYESDPHTIAVSSVMCKHYLHVLETVAHEMCHLAAEKEGHQGHSDHDESFQAKAKEVCDAFGWSLEGF